MARMVPHIFNGAGIALALGLGLVHSVHANDMEPKCPDLFAKDGKKILADFGDLQNPKKYTPERAKALQDRLEKYLESIGDHFKNYKIEPFINDELNSIPSIDTFVKAKNGNKKKLIEALRPYFESRNLPSYNQLQNHLKSEGLGRLPARRIREVMDLSFRKWKTKLIFDEMGEATFNRLAKAYVDRMKIGEFSMEVGLLGKNGWEAFFESEKGAGIFNPSVEGVLKDRFSEIEAHESIHMIVQTFASRGRESPYQTWIKMEEAFAKTGAIGEEQKKLLLKFRDDALNGGDYYRRELYADEIPAHIVEASFLNVHMSKILRKEFEEFLDTSAKSKVIREELDDLYAEYLRTDVAKIEWNDYSKKTQKLFNEFLEMTPSDLGRTGIGVKMRGLGDYMDWINILNNGVETAVKDARTIIDAEIAKAKALGLKGVPLTKDGPIKLTADNFLGKKGYLIEVRIPIDVLQKGGGKDGVWKREFGASVKLRFTSQGDPTKNIPPQKLKRLISQTDWTLRLNAEVNKSLSEYSQMVKDGKLEKFTVKDILKLKSLMTDLREVERRTLGEIRGN